MDKQKDIEMVKSLKHGQDCTVFWCEEGGGLVYRLFDAFILFYVAQYGGTEPTYEATFYESEIEKLVDLAWTWS